MPETTPNAEGRSSQSPSGSRPTPKMSSKDRTLAKQQERDKKWLENRLREVKKSDALANINANWRSYTPFEMSMLLDLGEVRQAVEARIMRFASICDSARNMLIIVPIIVTWFSLALAGTAYEQNLSLPHPNTKPFLQQWQEGFAPLPKVHLLLWDISLTRGNEHWFTFANFALTDAIVLAIILAFTVIGQSLEIWAYIRGTRITSILERFMYNLNANALFQSMENAPDAKTPPWLRELRTDLGHLGDVIDRMNSALDESMNRYTEAISQQKKAVSALVTDTQRIHDSIVQLNTLYQGGAEAARVYKQYIPGVTKDFANLAHTQQRSVHSMEHMTEMLAKSMRYLAEMTNHVRDAQNTLDRYRNDRGSRVPIFARGAPFSRPTGGLHYSGPLSQPSQTPTSNLDEYDMENTAEFPRQYSAPSSGTADDDTIFVPQFDEMELANGPDRSDGHQARRPGFLRRALGRIPIARRVVRRKR